MFVETDTSYRSLIAEGRGPNPRVPIPELNRTDADVTLLILAQDQVDYDVPSDDPWFSAHLEHNTTAAGIGLVWYVGDNYFNNLACADQHQFSNPSSAVLDGSCTSLTDGTTVIEELDHIGLSNLQLATAREPQ